MFFKFKFLKYEKVSYNSVASYLSYGTSVSHIRVKEKVSEFPAVTICNLNSFDVGTSNFSGYYIIKVNIYFILIFSKWEIN